MNITFIGNCQKVSLCFYFQQLLNSSDYNICYIVSNKEFISNLGDWSDKCINKITNECEAIQRIKDSDIIIYRDFRIETSKYSNTTTLKKIKKISCKLINIPYISLGNAHCDYSIKKLINEENIHNVDIKVSDILYKFQHTNIKLMLSLSHPTTFLFMEIVKNICTLLNLEFFTEEQYNKFLENENYMKLP
jgi:hypothetical protein